MELLIKNHNAEFSFIAQWACVSTCIFACVSLCCRLIGFPGLSWFVFIFHFHSSFPF